MIVLLLLPAVLSVLLLAAHLFRAGLSVLALPLLLFYLLLFVRRGWVARLYQAFLLVAALEWVRTAIFGALERQDAGRPWVRMAVILGCVAAFNLFGAALFETATLLRVYPRRTYW